MNEKYYEIKKKLRSICSWADVCIIIFIIIFTRRHPMASILYIYFYTFLCFPVYFLLPYTLLCTSISVFILYYILFFFILYLIVMEISLRDKCFLLVFRYKFYFIDLFFSSFLLMILKHCAKMVLSFKVRRNKISNTSEQKICFFFYF